MTKLQGLHPVRLSWEPCIPPENGVHGGIRSPRFTCRRSCGSLQPDWSRGERSLFFSFSGMNNIPSAGERAYQEANRKGREIAASVTDKSVAEQSKCTRVSGKAASCTLTHAHTHSHSLTDSSARLQQKKFREKADLKKVGWKKFRLWIHLNIMAFRKRSLLVL
ncbi:hypothetical protein PAMA_003759 [Pampus argenteus]